MIDFDGFNVHDVVAPALVPVDDARKEVMWTKESRVWSRVEAGIDAG